MKKGDTVFYIADPHTRTLVKAKIVTAHKDGTFAVEARFYYRDGKTVGYLIGCTYPGIDADLLFPNAKAADDAIAAYELA